MPPLEPRSQGGYRPASSDAEEISATAVGEVGFTIVNFCRRADSRFGDDFASMVRLQSIETARPARRAIAAIVAAVDLCSFSPPFRTLELPNGSGDSFLHSIC